MTGSTRPARSAVASRQVEANDPVSRLIAVAVDHLLRHLPALDPLRRLLETVSRFAGVGVASSLLYALVVAVETSGLGLDPDLSAVLAYGILIPFNFLLHRYFTFRSASPVSGDLVRYGFAQALNVAVSFAAMALAVDALGLPYGFGILGAIVLVPIMTYLLLDRWVFAKKA